MTTISRQEVIKIAKISQIAIHDQEIEALTQNLDQVLSYAKRVAEIDGNVQGISQKNINIFREDIVIPCFPEPILAQAPERADNYFVVPTILETV